ncbi:hypothetical protein QL285_028397 [Trifolium repens]|nr:hypothetical protein QL285_028397 [Trifolium repens]
MTTASEAKGIYVTQELTYPEPMIEEQSTSRIWTPSETQRILQISADLGNGHNHQSQLKSKLNHSTSPPSPRQKPPPEPPNHHGHQEPKPHQQHHNLISNTTSGHPTLTQHRHPPNCHQPRPPQQHHKLLTTPPPTVTQPHRSQNRAVAPPTPPPKPKQPKLETGPAQHDPNTRPENHAGVHENRRRRRKRTTPLRSLQQICHIPTDIFSDVSPFLRLPSVNDSRSSCLLFDSSIQFRPFTINDSLSSTLLSIQFASPNHPSKASVQLSYLLPLVLLAFEFRDIDVSPPTSTQSGTNVL